MGWVTYRGCTENQAKMLFPKSDRIRNQFDWKENLFQQQNEIPFLGQMSYCFQYKNR